MKQLRFCCVGLLLAASLVLAGFGAEQWLIHAFALGRGGAPAAALAWRVTASRRLPSLVMR
jgi:hypothetical protein